MKIKKNQDEQDLEALEEIEKEAVEEVAHPKSNNGKTYGIISLILGLMGLVLIPFIPIITIFLAGIGLLLASSAIKSGYGLLGRIAGIICFIDLLIFIIPVSINLSRGLF